MREPFFSGKTAWNYIEFSLWANAHLPFATSIYLFFIDCKWSIYELEVRPKFTWISSLNPKQHALFYTPTLSIHPKLKRDIFLDIPFTVKRFILSFLSWFFLQSLFLLQSKAEKGNFPFYLEPNWLPLNFLHPNAISKILQFERNLLVAKYEFRVQFIISDIVYNFKIVIENRYGA